jgi:hypothetical protein
MLFWEECCLWVFFFPNNTIFCFSGGLLDESNLQGFKTTKTWQREKWREALLRWVYLLQKTASSILSWGKEPPEAKI